MPRRSKDKMFAGASAAVQKADEIARLRQELEDLKASYAQGRAANDFQKIATEQIMALRLPDGMGQPRKYFDATKMEQLKVSIEKHGILEPILVRPSSDGFYETVSGERRWRCCHDLGKSTVLARVKPLNDEEALEVALIATIHSEGVSLVEETDSVLALMKLYLGIKGDQDNRKIKALLEGAKNYRQTGYGDIAETKVELLEATLTSFGFNLSSFVSNRLSLLNIEPQILEAVRIGTISPTNALLINRAPSVEHEALIEFGKSATKNELIQKIKQVKHADTANGSAPHDSDLRERVHNYYGQVRKKRTWTKIQANPKLKKKMERVENLLSELLSATTDESEEHKDA